MTTGAPVAERRDGCMRQGPSGWPTLAARDAFGQRLQHRFGGPPGAIRVEPGAVGDPRQELRGRHGLEVRASGQQGPEILGQLGHDVVVLLGGRLAQCGEDGGGTTLCGGQVNLCALADPAHEIVDIEALCSPRASVQPPVCSRGPNSTGSSPAA